MTKKLFVALLVLTCSFKGHAHHSFGAFYDMSTGVELEGEITSVLWRNPHVRFTMDVIADDGSVVRWRMEAGSVNTLQRFGIGRELINAGTSIRVWGLASRHGRDEMFVVSVFPEGGEEVVLNPNLAANLERPGDEPLPTALEISDDLVAIAESEAGGIFRVWVPESRPNTGSGLHVWPLTQVGQAARDAWSPLVDDPALRCIPPGIPAAMDNPYPIEFIDNGDTITLRLEEWDGLRTIHMSDEARPENMERPHLGFSVGRWEGNTLTITTTNIDYPFFDDVGTPLSSDAVLVEQFTVSDDGNRLDWNATTSDPLNFNEPITLRGSWKWVPGEQIKAYECTLEPGQQ